MSAARERLAQIYRLIRSYRFQSLLVRNAAISFGLVLIPLLAMGFATYRNVEGHIRSSLIELNAATSIRVRDTIDAAIRDTNRMTASLVLEQETWSLFRGIWPDLRADERYTGVRRLITRFAHIYPYIESIYAYSELNDVVVAGHGAWPISRFDDTGWAVDYLSGDGSELQLVSRRKFGAYPLLITGIRREYASDGRRLGAVVINIDVELLARIISESEPGMVQHTYVVGDDDTILLHRDRALIGERTTDVPLFGGIGLDQPDQTVSLRFGGRNHIVSWAHSTYGTLAYVVTLPLDLQTDRLAAAHTYLLASVVVAIVASAIIALLVSVYSYEPVSDVVQLLSDPDGEPVRSHRSGEISYIAEQLTTVIHSNRRLNTEVEERLGLLHSAQIAALQAQVNPHFLYNALEGINWLAIRTTGDENDVSRAIGNLSDLLRYSVGSDHQVVGLAVEIEHARAYLKVMEIRYPDRWTVRWNIDPDVMCCGVPRMVLQPILENAVQHGVVPVRRSGVIGVAAHRSADSLVLEVADNGVGMPMGALDALNSELAGSAGIGGDHIGLRNVNHRVRLLYSDAFGIRLVPNRGPGITVRIRLPVSSPLDAAAMDDLEHNENPLPS